MKIRKSQLEILIEAYLEESIFGKETKGTKASSLGGTFFNSSDPDGNSDSELENAELIGDEKVQVSGGNYPKENVKYVEDAMTEKGITNKYVRVGILCTIAKESNFIPKSEKTYDKTDNSKIFKIWPKLKKLGNEKVNQMKKKTSPSDGHRKPGLGFFDYLYGGKYGNGNESTGDGSRYRGRGFNQVTFKGSYEKYGNLAGVDLVSNPDKLNDPRTAAKVAVAFLANRLESHYGSANPNAKSYEEGVKMAAIANCKSKKGNKNCSRAIQKATERLPHFKY